MPTSGPSRADISPMSAGLMPILQIKRFPNAFLGSISTSSRRGANTWQKASRVHWPAQTPSPDVVSCLHLLASISRMFSPRSGRGPARCSHTVRIDAHCQTRKAGEKRRHRCWEVLPRRAAPPAAMTLAQMRRDAR